MKPRGKHSKVTEQELEMIREMKKTIPAKQLSRILGRSMCVIVYADKPKPEPKKQGGFFNYSERENWLL